MSGSTSREFIENTELDGGYGYPLVLEETFDDEIKATFGGGVGGSAPAGHSYAVKMEGDVQSVALDGQIKVWPRAVYFDTSNEVLRVTSSSFRLTMAVAEGIPIVLGAAGDPCPVESFNENIFQVTSAPGSPLSVNNANWQPMYPSGLTWVPGNGNTLFLQPAQLLDPFWTSQFTTNVVVQLPN